MSISIFGLTQPAPLIATSSTCHMIASAILLNHHFTFFAPLQFLLVFPVLNFLFIHLIAGYLWVSFPIANRAHLYFTMFTSNLFIFNALKFYRFSALSIAAPPLERIFFKQNIIYKCLILIKSVDIYWIFNSFLFYLCFTMWTRDCVHSSTIYKLK